MCAMRTALCACHRPAVCAYRRPAVRAYHRPPVCAYGLVQVERRELSPLRMRLALSTRMAHI